MTLTKSLLLFILSVSRHVINSEQVTRQNQHEKEIKYSKYDYSDDWQPNKFQIQDRFHPVVNHHMKPNQISPSQPNQPLIIAKPNANNQGIRLNTPPVIINNIDGNGFKSANDIPSAELFQFDQVPDSHEGEIIPGFVNEISFQKQNVKYRPQDLDFPSASFVNGIDYIEFTTKRTTTSAPAVEFTKTPLPNLGTSNNVTELKTIYVPWIFVPPKPKYKLEGESYKDSKPVKSGYPGPPPKSSYLPPEPGYLPPKPSYLPPPEPSYLPPEPTYLPPPKPTYLPPEPTYLPPPKPTYLPPEPMGYSYPPSDSYSYPKPPLPPLLPPDVDEKEKAAEFTYFFLGRKLWYIPLYFSIYFVLYVGYLVLKAIARHKIMFPHLLHNAAVVSARGFYSVNHTDWMKYFPEMNELNQVVGEAFENFQKKC